MLIVSLFELKQFTKTFFIERKPAILSEPACVKTAVLQPKQAKKTIIK